MFVIGEFYFDGEEYYLALDDQVLLNSNLDLVTEIRKPFERSKDSIGYICEVWGRAVSIIDEIFRSYQVKVVPRDSGPRGKCRGARVFYYTTYRTLGDGKWWTTL